MSERRELLNSDALDESLAKLAKQIAGDISESKDAALVGIRTRGVPMARRIHKQLALEHEWNLPMGILDITLYRDDLSTLGAQPMVRESELPFDVDGKTIILIDDVLYTGRTVRAAIEAIIAYGRPKAIRLAVLVDRGHREYPIQPDYCALKIDTKQNEIVQVRFEEIDGSEEVCLIERDGEN